MDQIQTTGPPQIINISTQYIRNTCITPKTSISSKINDNKNKTRNLYKILKSLTKLKDDNPMPPTESTSDLPNTFADFFLNKIQKTKEQFQDTDTHKSYHRKCTKFTSFVPLEKNEILNFIKKNESNNLYHGPLQYQISTKIQGHNLRLHHHHC